MSKTAESVLKSARENNEPVFVLRAKDVLSFKAMADYYGHCLSNCNESFTKEIKRIALDFAIWQEKNPEQVRIPD